MRSGPRERISSQQRDVELVGVRGIIIYLCLCACERLQGNGGHTYTVLTEHTFLKVLIEGITFFMLQHDDEMMMKW